jgi:type II secretory pathway component PulF
MVTTPESSGGIKRVRRVGKRVAAAEPKVAPLSVAPSSAPLSVMSAPPSVTSVVTPVLAPASPVSSFFTVGSVKSGDITSFLRQLIMLIEAGTPLLRSLNTLAERGEKPSVRALVADIAHYVENGNPLWQAFERHPGYFDTVFVNLVKASEASGTLVAVLQRLISYRERREMLIKRVRSGMLYPAILVVACFAVIVLIAWVIVPTFEDVFAKLQVNVPASTRYFMGGAKLVGQFWWVGILFIGVLVLVYKYWYVQNPLRRLTADRYKLKIPIIGNILLKNAIVEFSRTLSLLLKSGMSMMATLDLVRNAIHNRAFANTIQSMRDSVERGEGLERPMRQASDIIPGVVVDMLVTGEESGRLDVIADQIAATYEEEVNIAISSLSDALQPILTIIIGVMVVALMLSIFVPLINMINTLGASGA